MLAGLQSIPDDLYAAAKVDGASAFSRVRFITIPLLLPSFGIALVVEFIAAFQIFDVIWTLTAGGSAGGGMNPFTKTLMLYNYELVFRDCASVWARRALVYHPADVARGRLIFVMRVYNQGVQDNDLGNRCYPHPKPLPRAREGLSNTSPSLNGKRDTSPPSSWWGKGPGDGRDWTARARNAWRLALIYLLCAVVLIWALAPIYWVAGQQRLDPPGTLRPPLQDLVPQPANARIVSDDLHARREIPLRRLLADRPPDGHGPAQQRHHLPVASAGIVTLMATGAGYAFARMDFRGKNIIFLLFMLMIPLPIWVSLIALFFLMSQLDLIDTLVGLVLIFVTLLLPLSVWLMTTSCAISRARFRMPPASMAPIAGGWSIASCCRWRAWVWSPSSSCLCSRPGTTS